jgi:anti-anti-sigma factor
MSSTIVRLDGALDVAAAPALRDRLIGLLLPGTRLLVLDLSRVPSCDSAGLAVLVGAGRRARALGVVMRLAAPSAPVAKLLRLTGLDRNLGCRKTTSSTTSPPTSMPLRRGSCTPCSSLWPRPRSGT